MERRPGFKTVRGVGARVLVEARVRFDHPAAYAGRLPPGVQMVQVSGDFGRGLSTLTGPSSDALREGLAAVSAWLDEPPQIIEETPVALVMRHNAPTRGLASLFACWGASVLWPAVHREASEWWHVAAPTPDVMADVLRRLGEHGTVHVERLGRPSADEVGVSLPVGELTRILSPRQASALRLAIARGYYAAPRRATLGELAAAAKLSRSTYQEHLQKAEAEVMQRFGSVLVDHPALVLAATKGAGRPRAR